MLNPKSIAVLPFTNLSSSEESEYFSDGITDEIINALSKIQGLKVIARTSSFAYKNQAIDVRKIGNTLGVESVLEGTVRQYKQQVRILVALVQTSNGAQIWSESFSRSLEDIFALQDEISLLIADKIRENFGHLEIQENLVEVSTQNIDAYELYLKARHQHLRWDGEGIRNSVALYEECIALEPNFSLPYFGLGYSYAMFGCWGNDRALLDLSENKLKAGFALNPKSDLGYFGKATLYFWGKWDFRQGHEFFQKALELNPACTEAEEGLCELYTAIGYFEEAHKSADNILKINPLSPNHYFTKANIYYLSSHFNEAVKCLEVALKINPQFKHAVVLLQICYVHLKQYEKLDRFLSEAPLAERPEECRVLYALMHPDEDIGIDVRHVGAQIKQGFGTTIMPWQLLLLVHLGEKQLALDFLEENIKSRTGQIINFQHTPLLEPLHKEPRFKRLKATVFSARVLPPRTLKSVSFGPETTFRELMSPEEAQEVLERLESGMITESWYEDPELSLRKLAERLSIHSNKLSWLINEKTKRNFNEYLNLYRLKAFQRKAQSPQNAHLTLLGMAYESGFNSKSVFNAFFKKETGMTPKAWLKAQKA